MRVLKSYGVYYLILILFVSAGLISCSDNGIGSENSTQGFTFKGEVYELEWGAVADLGEQTSGFRRYNFALFEVEEEDTTFQNINSSYEVGLGLESKGADSFDAGTYVFSDTPTDENYIYTGGLVFFGDAEDEYYNITDGEVTVSVDGDTYTLDMDLTVENNAGEEQTLTGSFSHDFDIYDMSGSAKY